VYNGNDGSFVDAASSSNRIVSVAADSNEHFGFLDRSSDSGTEGSANLYAHDSCVANGPGSSSPPGLCS
jgi:hypothetical protein